METETSSLPQETDFLPGDYFETSSNEELISAYEVVNHYALQREERAKQQISKFVEWCKTITDYDTLYNEFETHFSCDFRIELFGFIRSFWLNEECITSEVVFYWKIIVYNLIRSHKKYQVYAKEYGLFFDFDSRETNLRLVKQKSSFRCFITKEVQDVDNDEEPVCYFKENGFSYYVS